MKKIFKYLLPVRDYDVTASMPKDAKLLHVAVQNNEVFVWALVDPDADQHETRHFEVVGTGHSVPEHAKEYLGTVHLMNGQLVLHVFEAVQDIPF